MTSTTHPTGRARRPLAIALLLLLALVAAACGDDDGEATTATTPPPDTTAASGSTTSAVPEPSGEPLRIGSVITQDSPLISFASAADTLEAWVEWVNDTGGIAGRPVEVDVYDDKLDPTVAREAFGKLTGDDSMLAIVGAFAPLGLGAALPDIDASGIPLVPGSGLVLAEFSTKSAYMLVTEPQDFGYQACTEAMRRGYEKAALLFLDTAEVRPIIDGYKSCAKDGGGEVVLEEAVAFGAPSLTDTALRVIDSGADVIFLEIDAATTAQLWAELDRQGARIPSFGNPGIYEDALRDYGGPAAEGFVMQTSVLPPHLDDEAVAQVREVVEKYRPGTKLTPVAMNTWVGAELFRAAAEAAAPDITRASLVAALDTISGFDAGGLIPPIDFSPDDHLGTDSYWFFELVDGEWGPLGPLREMP